MKKIECLVLVSLLLVVFFTSTVSGQETRGPKMDELRFQVVESEDAQLVSMQTGQTHVLPTLSTPMDLWPMGDAEKNGGLSINAIEKLSSEGFTVTRDLGFHLGYIGYNIRDTETIQSYYRPEIDYWPFHDVAFRHALIHCYDQLSIVPQIYGPTAVPIHSLVPPAQARFYNPNVPQHPFNPGNPFTSPPTEHSTCGILKAAGYTFVDADSSGTVTDPDYWRCPDQSPLPYLKIWTPLPEEALTSYLHGLEFVSDLRNLGLCASTANGNHGLALVPRQFNMYLLDVYQAKFDAFMTFYSVGRFPDQLYSWLHWSQDSLLYPGKRNAVGVIDPTIDELVETVMHSLSLPEIEIAARQVQEKLCDPGLPNADNFALGYMCLCSRIRFNAYNPDLRGIIKSGGYGSDNKWTFLNINWWLGSPQIEPVVWTLGQDPTNYNPLSANTNYSWELLAQVYDGLLNVNPYSHRDIPWLASDWTITPTTSGMEIDIVLRDDVYWQDGWEFNATHVEFCLEFIKNYQIPRYARMWENLIDVVVTNATHLKIIASNQGLLLFYCFTSLAAMLPRHIWDRPWPNQQAVLEYNPTEPYNVAPVYTPGPRPPPTNLFGTGPFIFQYYDPILKYYKFSPNTDYFLTIEAIHDQIVEMFWEIGDANRDGIINVIDLTLVSFSYGSTCNDPGYNPDADFNQDCIVDMRDLHICAYHLGWKREYP